MLKLVAALFLHTLVLADACDPPFSENDLRCNAAMLDIMGQMERIVKAKVYELNGWVKSKNFLFKKFDNLVDYKTAESRCNTFCGRLATEILRHCEAVRFIIAAKYFTAKQGKPWIGYTDRKTEGSWVWADGGVTDTQTTGWSPNEPNSDGGRNEDCAHVISTAEGKLLMNDQTCTWKHSYICEINIDDL